jgi:hypothetical protein
VTHIRKLSLVYQQKYGSRAIYWHLPRVMGLNFAVTYRDVTDHVKAVAGDQVLSSVPVDVFGYSRGAIYALRIADRLATHGYTVRLVYAIDPVSRGIARPPAVVSARIQTVRIAYAGQKMTCGSLAGGNLVRVVANALTLGRADAVVGWVFSAFKLKDGGQRFLPKVFEQIDHASMGVEDQVYEDMVRFL